MKQFYTSVMIRGNKILHRGYKNGNQFSEETNFEPSLFIQSQKPSVWKTLDGKNVEPVVFDSIDSAREFTTKYDKVQGFPIYGNTDYIYQFIAEKYSTDIDYDISAIRIAYIDIETESEGGFPNIETANERINVISMMVNDNMIVFALGVVDLTQMPKDADVRLYDSEEMMLNDFLDEWKKQAVDIITGWNVQFFDIPYIINRYKAVFGDNRAFKFSPWGKLKERKVKIMDREQQTYEIVGINTIDYFDLYKKFTYVTRESYKLDHIAQVELGEKKVSFGEHDNFSDFYTKDFTKFVQYNIQDTRLVAKLEAKLRLMELAVSLAYTAKVNLNDVFSQVRTWEQIIYHHLHQKKIVIPPKKFEKKDTMFVGAYVKEPKPGAYKWVASFDLDSLYPHLIMQYNISPETKTFYGERGLITPEAMLIPPTDLIDSFIKSNVKANCAVAANGTTYRRDIRGFLPELMSVMYDERKKFKQLMLETKAELKNLPKGASKETKHKLNMLISKYHNFQLCRKIQLNSAYGAVGNEWFRYYDIDIAEAITTSGQLSIRWIEAGINEYMNKVVSTTGVDYVIASDTDSIYLHLDPLVQKVMPNTVDEEKITLFLDKVCNEVLQKEITKRYQELATRMNAYEQKMNMKRESIASKGIWTAKKRYILNLRMGEENVYLKEAELKVTGIETVRSSTPEIVREALRNVISLIISKDESTVQEFVKAFRNQFEGLEAKAIASPRSCNGLKEYANESTIYKKGTPIATKGSLLFNWNLRKHKLRGKYQDIREGDKIKFIYLVTPNPIGDKVISFTSKIPKEFDLSGYIDYQLQFEKTFLDPLKHILAAVGWQAEHIDTLENLFN